MSKPVDMPQDLFDLYAEFGIASEKAQLLETEAGNAALSYVTLFTDTNKITAEQREIFKALLVDVNRKTLGAVLTQIKSIGTFDQTLLNAIDEGLKQRNYLTHKFFRAHNFAIHNETGRATMTQELQSIQDTLQKAWNILSAVTNSLNHFAGIPQQSEYEIRNLMAAGRNKSIW